MPAARFPPARAAQLLAYLALANAATAAASWLVLEDERERSTDPSYWTVDENYDFKGETRLLSEPDFQRIFRLSRTGFDEVLGRMHVSTAISTSMFVKQDGLKAAATIAEPIAQWPLRHRAPAARPRRCRPCRAYRPSYRSDFSSPLGSASL